MPATKERTPQRIGGRRFVLLKSSRTKAIDAEVASLHLTHVARQANVMRAAVAPPSNLAVLAAAESQLGKPYCLSGCRCAPGCSCRDCSGEVIYSVNAAGLNPQYPCVSSFSIAVFCRDHGTIVDMDYAIATAACVGVRNPWGDPNFNGSNGHTWLTKGDRAKTVEEGGHATGCYEGSVFGRDHGYPLIWARFPGIAYDAAVTGHTGEPMLFLDKVNSPAGPNRHRSASVTPDGIILLGNGAKVHGSGGRGNLNGVPFIKPPALGAPFMGAASDGPNGFVLQYLQSDASFADFHYSFTA